MPDKPSKTFLPPLAMGREAWRWGQAWVRQSFLAVPGRAWQLWRMTDDESLPGESRWQSLLQESFMALFDDLGPIYGKAGQVALSRLPGPGQALAKQIGADRLYRDWPPLPFSVVEEILDRETPSWRDQLKVSPEPLGVASIAQVHGAFDHEGRSWVVKVVKPQAKRRLRESLSAIEAVLAAAENVAVTRSGRRLVGNGKRLCHALAREVDLRYEREQIERVSQSLRSRRQKTLCLPQLHESLHSPDVLVLERFTGISLADVVSGKKSLEPKQRARLARRMLNELLIQVFELGLFHGDPHAGNLMLLPDGRVGLFDWGLVGELREQDRAHIAAVLKAVLAMDKDRLIDALMDMVEPGQEQPSRQRVERELRKVTILFQQAKSEEGKRPPLRVLFQAALQGAERMGIEIPEGLLMMVKSLMTIEGLAQGVDPEVSFGRVAAPILLKAARPGVADLWRLGRQLPKIVERWSKS